MEKTINTITKIVVWIIMALGVIFTFWTINNGSHFDGNVALQNEVLNPYFMLSAIVFVIAAAVALLFPIGQMAGNPKSLVRALISLGILALVYIISWSLASDSIDASFYKEFNITPGQSKFIG